MATVKQGAELAVLETLDSAPHLRIDVLMVEAEFVQRGGDKKIAKEVLTCMYVCTFGAGNR